jgi:predicted O-methyltransferase YrrM
MRVLERTLLIVALVIAAISLVVLAARPSFSAISIAGLVLALLFCGIAIFVKLARLEQRLGERQIPSPEDWGVVTRRLGHGVGSVQESTRRAIVRDIGSLLTLHELVAIKGETPAHAPWVAQPETVLALVGYVRELPDDAVVLDIGSGLSTVWLGLAAQQQGRGIRVVALEHDPEFAVNTRAALARQGLLDFVDLREAPLEGVIVEGEKYAWYAASTYQGLENVGLVFVDGPPGSTGDGARFPALPLLASSLIDGALLVLDDTNRSEERAIIKRWIADPGLDGRAIHERDLDHATVVRFQRSPATDPPQRIAKPEENGKD